MSELKLPLNGSQVRVHHGLTNNNEVVVEFAVLLTGRPVAVVTISAATARTMAAEILAGLESSEKLAATRLS